MTWVILPHVGGKSIWYIMMIGMVAVMLLTMMMCFSLQQFETSPAGQDTKLALAVRTKFNFDSVGAVVGREAGKKVLRVAYLTLRDSKFNDAVQKKEATEVATYAIGKYEGRDKGALEEIRITRKERHGTGCWQQTYTTYHSIPNPEKGKWMKPTRGRKVKRLPPK